MMHLIYRQDGGGQGEENWTPINWSRSGERAAAMAAKDEAKFGLRTKVEVWKPSGLSGARGERGGER